MKISELENTPHWLKIASTLDEDVEIINGLVIWKGGIWECGNLPVCFSYSNVCAYT